MNFTDGDKDTREGFMSVHVTHMTDEINTTAACKYEYTPRAQCFTTALNCSLVSYILKLVLVTGPCMCTFGKGRSEEQKWSADRRQPLRNTPYCMLFFKLFPTIGGRNELLAMEERCVDIQTSLGG